MTRNLKALGLALMAAFAFSAVAASSASAQETEGHITSESTEVTLTGTETGAAGANSFTAFGSTVECPGSTYTGHKFNVTPHERIHSGETKITVTPHYVNCNKPVQMNECDYVFRDATTDGHPNAGTYDVTVDVVCPEGKSIEISPASICTTTVPAQTGLTGFHLTNTPANAPEGTPKDHIDLTGTINVAASNHCLGSTTAIQHIDVRIKGHDASGIETGVTVSD